MVFRNVSTRFIAKLKKRLVHTDLQLRKDFENPFWRTARVLSKDIGFGRKKKYEDLNNNENALQGPFPSHVDIAIIGGGAIGSSIAYWLKEKTNETALNVVVIEKDLTYSKCSTTLSVGGLRQQFSLPENIQMSLYGAEFLRTLKNRFGPDADVNFTPHGYLVLASESGAEQLIDNSRLQNQLGAINIILNKEQIKERFPWMNVTDVEFGCLGLEKEGWFDPWSLLQLLKKGAMNKGTQYINGEVVDFLFEDKQEVYIDGSYEGNFQLPREVVVKLPDGEQKAITFAYCIIAAGPESGSIGKLANIGIGANILSIPIPVERRKRFVYCFTCEKNPPGINTPLTIDYSGTYFRRDGLGGSFICGLSPEADEEPETTNLDVNHEYFNDKVWPNLAKRVPAFNALKLKSSWSGFYEYNTFDENGIIGPHPSYHNLYVASGFSGHGIQQAPAVGRAVAELILDGNFQTLDLTRLGFDRFVVNKPLYEIAIY